MRGFSQRSPDLAECHQSRQQDCLVPAVLEHFLENWADLPEIELVGECFGEHPESGHSAVVHEPGGDTESPDELLEVGPLVQLR